MQPEPPLSFLPQLCQRFQALVWSCLDSDLTKSAIFYAEKYFAIDEKNHDARHLYATALLRENQPFSALHLVDIPADARCGGCLEIKAKCCTLLGRHRQARDALEETVHDPTYAPSASTSPRIARPFPDEAAIRCRSGTMALKGKLSEQASISFRHALSLNPMLWEAFEGLCALDSIPEIDTLFPPRPAPVKRTPPEEPPPKPVPIATGAGFFTPDTGNAGNLFRPWKPELPPPQLFRMGPPLGPTAIHDSSFHPADASFLHPPTKSQPIVNAANPHASRPLSSADEAGPVLKKLRSTVRQPEPIKSLKPTKLTLDDPLKKARARPALTFANFFSSSGRRSQPTTSSRIATGGKNSQAANAVVGTRRSTRLLSGTANKPTHGPKHPPTRDRRRQPPRSHSIESEMDEESHPTGEVAHSPSPRSETSPSPSNWTAAHEQAAQEAYEAELAEHYIYDLVRRLASATRALAMYDCQKCLEELEQLPHVHQRSAWALALAGKAHYEKLDYASAERAFKTVRDLEPYRLWDMEVYSTLLWHLEQKVQLSFLAQELLNIDPRCPQAWIAVGNLFSLQKERSQALTCFRRAAQLDPTCAYAYTLSGHESIDEDLEKAINFFQSALRADPRHYNAWYGLGTCYLRMSKIRLAEYHYRKAVEIHPNNAVLLGCVGMAVERRGDQDSALGMFDEAVQLAPENALVRYRRAKILIAMKRYNAAVKDLEYLRSTSPEESNVVFQLAKVYRLLGNEAKSAQLLAVARDISPKSLTKMKKLLETVKDVEGAVDGDEQHRMDVG